MEKLIEMANAGVQLTMFGPWKYRENWKLTGEKEDDGTKLSINTEGRSLEEAINDLYERWVSATRGLPNHGLRQIEHVQPAPPPFDPTANAPHPLDDEIPF